jgi:nucleotide-binding universal stress UspA family protein
MAGDIVLGYDGSDGSKAALAVAVSVAKAFDAPLSIVFGYEPNPMGGETADYKDKLEKIGEDMVGGALAAAKKIDSSVHTEVLVVPLRPVESLLEAALERSARVIVVGGSGERPIVGAILGSVPHKLLHRSDVPVLVVPAGDD